MNDLGRYDKCNRQPGFHYYTVGLSPDEFFLPLNLITIGICIPEECGHDNLEAALTPFLMAHEDDLGIGTFVIEYANPWEQLPINERGVDRRAWTLICVFIFITLLNFIGILVQYTKLLHKRGADKTAAVEKQKTKLG